MVAGGGFYLICVLWHVSNLILITSLFDHPPPPAASVDSQPTSPLS